MSPTLGNRHFLFFFDPGELLLTDFDRRGRLAVVDDEDSPHQFAQLLLEPTVSRRTCGLAFEGPLLTFDFEQDVGHTGKVLP